MRRIVIINKFGPSSLSITATSALNLAVELSKNGSHVTFIYLDATYKNDKRLSELPHFTGDNISLPSWGSSNNPILRLIISLIDGFRLIRISKKIDYDFRIIMTDPPLLYFWATIFKRRKKKDIYWTMDLYPEAFAAGNYISSSNLLYKHILEKIYKSTPSLLITLGPQQKDYLEKQFKNEIKSVILPCGIITSTEILDEPRWKRENLGKIIFAYGGNIGEAHDEHFLIAFINQLNPTLHKIILSLYGSKKNVVLSKITNHDAVILVNNISNSDQFFVDISVVSLLPSWDNICVPSKAVTAICNGTALLINSSTDSEAWTMFKDSSWLIQHNNQYELPIKRYLSNLSIEEVNIRKTNSTNMAVSLCETNKIAINIIQAHIEGGV